MGASAPQHLIRYWELYQNFRPTVTGKHIGSYTKIFWADSDRETNIRDSLYADFSVERTYEIRGEHLHENGVSRQFSRWWRFLGSRR